MRIAVLLLTLALAALALPPRPGVLEGTGSPLPVFPPGVEVAGPNKLKGYSELETVTILMQFPDNPADTAERSPARFDSMLYSTGVYTGLPYRQGSLNDYFLECSYGDYHVRGGIAGDSWFTSTYNYSRYYDGNYMLSTGDQLAEENLAQVDAYVDFSQFDLNNDDHIDDHNDHGRSHNYDDDSGCDHHHDGTGDNDGGGPADGCDGPAGDPNDHHCRSDNNNDNHRAATRRRVRPFGRVSVRFAHQQPAGFRWPAGSCPCRGVAIVCAFLVPAHGRDRNVRALEYVQHPRPMAIRGREHRGQHLRAIGVQRSRRQQRALRQHGQPDVHGDRLGCVDRRRRETLGHPRVPGMTAR